MPIRLDARAPDFAARFTAFVNARRESDQDVSQVVRDVIARVRESGDAALAEYSQRFDRIDVEKLGLRISQQEIKAARAQVSADVVQALELAAERIRAFHLQQRPTDSDTTDASGVRAGWRWRALDAAGLYVPGGLASYPSSVLMNAIPAKVAGVARLAMVTPTPDGRLNPLVLVAADIAGVDEVYRVGGAQAIAALAYGTKTIASVDKIVGPGNAYVAEAKRQLFGVVGIDMVAGPSEILVVADAQSDPRWLAIDLLSQAEHDATAQAILITDSADLAARTAEEVEAWLGQLATAKTARAAWEHYGALILVENLADAVPLIDRLAPEHLALSVENPDALLHSVRHAGSVFLGRHTPEAIGDYVGGPNHVLPTGRRARFSSGLSVADFMKRTTFLACSDQGLAAIGPAAVALAEAEGLEAHAQSVRVRLS